MREETEISSFALMLSLTHEIPACDGGSSGYSGRVILACLIRGSINQERTRPHRTAVTSRR